VKKLLTEFLSDLLIEKQERKFKAVKITGTEDRVTAFGSKGAMDRAIAQGTHRPYFPDQDAHLERPEKIGGRELAAMEKQKRDREDIENAARGSIQGEPPVRIDSSSVPPLSNKARSAGLEQLHNDFMDVLETGDSTAITEFMEIHQIRYDARKKTFYSMKTVGRDEKKIFGDGKDKDGKETGSGKRQRELYEKLVEMGVQIGDRNSNDPLKPSGIVPRDSRQPFSGRKIDEDTLEFEGKQYGRIPGGQFADHITRQVSQWRRNFISQNGRNPTNAEQKLATTRLVVIADAANRRFTVLEQLLVQSKKNPKPHEVAIFQGDEGTQKYVTSLQESLLKQVPNNDKFRDELTTTFTAITKATTEEETITGLNSLFKLLENTDNCRESMSAIAESMSVLLELKRGRQVIVPMSDNFKTADLISLSTEGQVDPTKVSLEELEKQVHVIYSSISVKLEEGAASSFAAKVLMSVFEPDHKKVTKTLLDLTSGHRDLFSPTKRQTKETEAEEHIKADLDRIRKYFNLPPNMPFSQVMKILKSGRVTCDESKCVTIGQDLPDYMTRPGVDQRAYGFYHAMLLSAEAIYNSTVIGQGFGNQYWGGKGFEEIDGINNQSKQSAEPNKSQRGRGAEQRPDYMVSHNRRSTPEDLRTGDPCRRSKKCNSTSK